MQRSILVISSKFGRITCRFRDIDATHKARK